MQDGSSELPADEPGRGRAADAVFSRLLLAKDLAAEALRLLQPNRHAADLLHGIVLADLAIDIAARVVLDVLVRQPKNTDFRSLLDAIPELGADSAQLALLHTLRNRAQHGGAAPPAATVADLRRDAEAGLVKLFALAGNDFERISSVPQLATDYFREPLEAALRRAPESPADAAALAARVFMRVHGWASDLVGHALLPGEMWVFVNGRWEDMRNEYACADKRQEFVSASLDTAAGLALGINVGSLVRFRALMSGHVAEHREEGFVFTHDEGAETITTADALWMIETIARAALRLESEWEAYRLVPVEEKAASRSRELPPNLEPAQHDLIEMLAASWRQGDDWPNFRRLRAAYARNRKWLKNILAELPDGLWRSEDSGDRRVERLCLTLRGLAMTQGSAPIVEAFLKVVQLGVDRFVADPLGKATVTGADLAALLPSVPPNELRKIGGLFASELHAATSPDGTWSWEVWLRHVAWDRASDFWEFVKRNEHRHRAHKLDIDGDDLLRKVYEHWRETGLGPRVAEFVVENRHQGDVLEWLWESSRNGDLLEFRAESAEHLSLSITAVARIAPAAPELTLFVAVLRMMREAYLDDQETAVPLDRIAARLGASASEIVRILPWFRDDYFAGVHPRGDPPDVELSGEEGLLAWEPLESVDAYLARRVARLTEKA